MSSPLVTRFFLQSSELDTQNFDREFIREKIDLTPVDNAFIKNIDQTVRFFKIRNLFITNPNLALKIEC